VNMKTNAKILEPFVTADNIGLSHHPLNYE